ncbi:MAG: hypothetical protein AVDCRST_MAG56-5574 [uncultured Cytophagales bacterium]|uniref:FCP1 homology domain-containing protein n=1 Tax=uncultured Cytophagales bacterium TaxID=158755 RepID=A0A6J4KD48_9SPHI|nr:MAG: hypothetical protein AVDCRST_MAG56-5574 [uncultured Cytophagales bacterium]
MKIAFDLDGTLITGGYTFPTQRTYALLKACGVEALRKGTIDLMRYFQQQGEEVWIYTTSYRSTFYIRLLFGLHGIFVNGVVNQAVHNQRVKDRTDWPRCSKYPPAFGIDLLVDDQEGVKMEAERYGFRMIWIKPEQDDWTEKVIHEYRKLKKEQDKTSP